MPEVVFRVRWPDDHVDHCVSPSRAITRFLEPGARYTVAEFVDRSRAGLNAASERVRAVFGHPCSRAAAQLAAIERAASRHDPASTVTVEAVTQP
jgi:uncharacterized repeat protein (TIGR04042 family)